MDNIEDNLMLCLAVCGHDGLVSKSEEECLFEIFNQHYSYDRSQFEKAVNKFFESEDSLEQLLSRISDHKTILIWAKQAAEADGLDIRENIALQRCYELIEL